MKTIVLVDDTPRMRTLETFAPRVVGRVRPE